METHYYLINGTVKKGGEMPNEKDIDTLRDYKQHYNNWLSSLQPCDIDESELKKIKEHLMFYIGEPPIDITDIVSSQVICNADRCDGECIECTNMILKVKFKQPTEKQVESYDVMDEFFKDLQEFKKEFVKIHEQAPHPFDVYFWIKESSKYKIFKNRK